MQFPGLVVAATAIALGIPSVAVAVERVTPTASTSEIQPVESIKPEALAVPQSKTFSTGIEPKRLADNSINSETASPATSLNGTIAADVSGMASNCPLKTEMLALSPEQIAQRGDGACPRPAVIEPLIIPEPYRAEASPALSIYIPVGYGLDGWSVWGSGNFQAEVREDSGSVGGGGIGVGLGDAKKYLGLELGYTVIDSEASFGEGGFSGKLHRRFPSDISVAFGWNGFANIGRNDFEHSIYGVATKIFRITDSLDRPFSRLSLSVGVGNGQFRSNFDRDRFQNGTNIFGNLSLRVIRPVSVIAEWTGQDLALGLSIAPFKNLPFVITPAVRDVTGSGYSPRFVIGAGVSFKF
jgi:hypothetical protein